MANHVTATRFTFAVWLCLLLLLDAETQAQRVNRPRTVAVPESNSVRIAVLPFRNAFARQSTQDPDASVLGDGIADSLTNGLKSTSGLTVIDAEIVLRAAARFPEAEIDAKDEDALRVANSLSAQSIVIGSFQLSRNHLHVDARLLTVHPTGAGPSRRMTADASYPDGYSTVLNQLLTSILTNLKIPLSQLDGNKQSDLAATSSQEAYRWYVLGAKEARGKTVEALSKAIEFFDKAIAADPNYAEALAAKSEAETLLYEVKKRGGENADAIGQAARTDGLSSVSRSPGSGRGYRALGRAQRALGDYAAASESEAAARKRWPGDTELSTNLARAMEDGKLVRSAYTDMMFLKHPDLALLLPQLPKVLVKNDSEYPVTVRIIPDQGQPYPTVTLGPQSSRYLPVFPGHCQIFVDGQVGKFEDQGNLEEGRDYEYVYSARSFPSGTFTFVNDGNYALQIRVSGPPSTSLVLRSRETKSITMPPGTYSVTARVFTAVKTGQYELSTGQEKKIVYSYKVGTLPVFDPAELTILNDGNAPLTATIMGSRRYSVTVPPGGKTMTLQAGTYTVRVSCGGDVSDAGEYQLSPNSEATVAGYSCTRRYRYVIR
jgi:TolB-like protein